MYANGTVSDLGALLSLIRNTCTANGWTLSGNILWKGACYVEIMLDGTIGVRIRGGTGKDGSNALVGGAPQYAYFGTIATIPLAYPMDVDIHLNTAPDEVYVVIHYSTSYYSLMSFGVSDVPGIAGTGCWFHANRSSNQGSWEYQTAAGGIDLSSNFGSHPDGFPMFAGYRGHAGSSSSGGGTNSYIHGDLDGGGWNANPDSTAFPNCNIFISPLLDYSPNLWNGEAILLPFPIYMYRAAGAKCSLLADFKHIRHVRLDFLQERQIITLGSDKWMVYPWFRKNAAAPDGGNQITHSGTLGYAVRYTGT